MYTLTHYCTYTGAFLIFEVRIPVLYERMSYIIDSVFLYKQYFSLAIYHNRRESPLRGVSV